MLFVRILLTVFATLIVIGVFYWLFRFFGGIATTIIGALIAIGLTIFYVLKVISFPIRLPFKIRKKRKEMEELRLETERIANMPDDSRGCDNDYF